MLKPVTNMREEDANRFWCDDARMSVADVGLMVSVLVVVAIVSKMLRAIRLLDGRVSLLQEELEHSRNTLQKRAAAKVAAPKLSTGKTPLECVPVGAAPSAAPRTPAPVLVENKVTEGERSPGEAAVHVIDEAEAEAVWARMTAEQERLKKAMGRDFRVRDSKRSAAAIRGKPAVRILSAREVAKKLERK
jgi:hypothetical protein